MKINVQYIGHIKAIVDNCQEEEIDVREDASVKDLLNVLSEKYGASFKKAVYEQGGNDVKSNFMVTVNGYLLNQLKGVETKLKNGDRAILMSVVSGG